MFANVNVTHVLESTKLWHLQLGHIRNNSMIELFKQALIGKSKLEELKLCETCVLAK